MIALPRPAASPALRHLQRLAVPLLVLALFGAPLAAALHHHDGGLPDHACAVCTAGHAPAIQAQPAPPTPAGERLAGRVTPPSAKPRAFRVAAIAPSRAPPPA